MVEVFAHKIDKTHIYYECPFCSTIKGGRIVNNIEKKYKSMHPTIHRHGSGGGLHNRRESRGSHCLYNKGDVLIHINDSTIRE